MKRKRFSEEQIIGVLREHDAGAKAADLAQQVATGCRQAAVQQSNIRPRTPSCLH